MTVNAVKETDKMPNYALEFVHENIEDAEQCKKTDCLIAGVAYAPGVGDTRFSPVEPFYNHISKLFLNTYIKNYFFIRIIKHIFIPKKTISFVHI